jgi:pyrroloquinoline-quinone synthase
VENVVTEPEFWEEMDVLLAKYDLLRHPYYEAWRNGVLSLRDLREYACEYYYHVASFPVYLREFAARLSDGALRQSVLQNLWDELGINSGDDLAHSLIWLKFAVGTGALPNDVYSRKPIQEMAALVETYLKMARTGTSAEALAAFYVYESQVPRISSEKAHSLSKIYGLDEVTCRYFALHTSADVAHSAIWREQLSNILTAEPKGARHALTAAERAAKALWRVLDGINSKRDLRKPASSTN